MPRFRFRLQPVLDQRLRFEQDRQLEVAAIERERLSLESELRACQEQLTASRLQMKQALSPGSTRTAFELRTVRFQAGATLHLQARARTAAIQLAGVYKRLERSRAVLRDAAAARRAVELLKERRMAEWKKDIESREMAEMDELATIRASHRSTEAQS